MPTPSDTLREQLAEFIAIPSVSADAAHAADIVAAAEWIAKKIRSAGGSAELVPWGARPLVVGEVAASERPESAPTVLCYAHFDVQPEDPLDLWESPPFELTHRDGRLYARGIADDKGNMFLLVEAVRQLAAAGELPVNVRFAFDGEEEIGGDSIVEWVDADQGDADAALILDGAMIRRGQPAFMVGVRGMVYAASACPDGRDRHALGNVRRGGAQCDARAHDRADRCHCRGADGRLPRRAPSRSDAAVSRGARGVGAAAVGCRAARAAGCVADRAGRGGGVLRADVRRHVARRERNRGRVAGSRQDRPAGGGARERLDAACARPGPGRRSGRRSSGSSETLCPKGAELEITIKNSARPALTPTGSDAIRLAGDAFEHVVGARPFLVRSGGTLPIYASLVARGLPTIATGFGIESECNVHAPNENVPEDAIELGVETMREVFVRLGQLGT